MTVDYRLLALGGSAAIALTMTLTVMGVPADPRPRLTPLPDGTEIMTRLVGDENSHYLLSSDSLPIVRGTDGYYYYTTVDAAGRPADSGIRVSAPGVASSAELLFKARADRPSLMGALEREARAHQPRRDKRRTPGVPDATYPCTGNQRGLVLLVEYSDVHFTTPDANTEFSRMLNEEGYSSYGGTGSARDWFVENSMGRFTPQFDVVGPVRLGHPMAYYGGNDKSGEDLCPEQMVIEACNLIDDEVDFSQYDADGDGYVDNVFVFYAGYGENLGGAAGEDCVWPHSWDIADTTTVPYIHDGVRLNHYACTNEIDLTGTMDGIGTFVHEFSHVLGLPDLYATNYSYAFTPGTWSVLDEGPYNNNSRTPPYYSAFERYSLGWLEPTEIGAPANIKLADISTNAACIVRTHLDNEYFIFENRQQKGWDTYLPHHGMLVWHIDYNENIWHYNTVNDRRDHQYADIEEADGIDNDATVTGDVFPGTANVTSFTDDTTPSMRSWDGSAQSKPVTEIMESNGFIYFKVSGGKEIVAPTEALAATEVTPESFVANWNPGEPESEYILTVYSTETGENGQVRISYVEGFDNLNVGESLSTLVTGLHPDTEYRYTVRVCDALSNLESVSSNEVMVTTLPPTFDYLAPVAHDPVDVRQNAFVMRWEPLDGADRYEVNVYTKETGEPEQLTCGFDGGLSALPTGWHTNSRLTYAASAYAGEDVPSLRLNAEGQYLDMECGAMPVRGLSFWHRGVSVDETSRLEILVRVDGMWSRLAQLPLTAEAGGAVSTIGGEEIPYGADGMRILFHPTGKCSVAIDDVTLQYGGTETLHPVAGYENAVAGNMTEFEVTGLEPATEYFYRVRGFAGEMASRQSREKRVVTAAESGMATVPGGEVLTVGEGVVTLNGLADGTPVRLYSVTGQILDIVTATDGKCAFHPDGAGVYLLVTPGKSYKVMIR